MLVPIPESAPNNVHLLAVQPKIRDFAHYYRDFEGLSLQSLANDLTLQLQDDVPIYSDEYATPIDAIKAGAAHCNQRAALVFAAAVQIPNVIPSIMTRHVHSYNFLASSVTNEVVMIDNFSDEDTDRNEASFEVTDMSNPSSQQSGFIEYHAAQKLLQFGANESKRLKIYTLKSRGVENGVSEIKSKYYQTLRIGMSAFRFIDRQFTVEDVNA